MQLRREGYHTVVEKELLDQVNYIVVSQVLARRSVWRLSTQAPANVPCVRTIRRQQYRRLE